MAVKELNTKEQYYADTREEADNMVEEAKEDMYLTSFKVSEKHNKYGTYYLVDLAFSYDTPREIMENAGPKEDPEAEPHEGVEYNVDGNGTVTLNESDDDNQEDDE